MAAALLAVLLLLQDEASLGNKAYLDGRYAEAADHFEKALAVEKDRTVPLWIAFGNASAQAGRWERRITRGASQVAVLVPSLITRRTCVHATCQRKLWFPAGANRKIE